MANSLVLRTASTISLDSPVDRELTYPLIRQIHNKNTNPFLRVWIFILFILLLGPYNLKAHVMTRARIFVIDVPTPHAVVRADTEHVCRVYASGVAAPGRVSPDAVLLLICPDPNSETRPLTSYCI